MTPTGLLKTLKVIAYRPIFVDITGSIKSALLLSQALYWQDIFGTGVFWFKTYEEWEKEIGITRHELDLAREHCKEYLQSRKQGIPPKLWYCLNLEILAVKLYETGSLKHPGNGTSLRRSMAEATPGIRAITNGEILEQVQDQKIIQADDSSIQLVKSFEASFSHYKKHRTIKELRKELEAAGHLLKVLPAPDVISLAQRCAADPFTGRRGFVANLQTMLAKLEALQAVYGVTQAPAEYEFKAEDGWMQDPVTGTRFRLPPPNKTYRQYREDMGSLCRRLQSQGRGTESRMVDRTSRGWKLGRYQCHDYEKHI